MNVLESVIPGQAVGVSLVTNASVRDAARLRMIIPHWFRVLGDEIAEISVLLDSRLPEGRIGRLQKEGSSLEAVAETLGELSNTYKKLRWQLLDYSTLELTSNIWWRNGTPLRCQDGSPVFAFAASVLTAHYRYVLRVDCDMLFLNRGWVQEAVKKLAAGQADIVSPPRLGATPTRFSSRAAIFDWPVFKARFLPMRAAKLDMLRRIHRSLHGRPTFLAYEDSLMKLIERGEIRHLILSEEFGRSLHVVKATDPALPDFPKVVSEWEQGNVPASQIEAGWDFGWPYWAKH
jgi:hypothetical protein